MSPTVATALALPVIRQGRPRVVAGAAGLGGVIRWVHAAEAADIARLLRGGELVLTTGIVLPHDDAALVTYVEELAEVGACGLMIELVRRWQDGLPPAMTAAAERHALPIVTLSRETRFVAVAEAVTALIVEAQMAELRAVERIHDTFTALTVSEAGPEEILREAAKTADLPVVLESASHDVLAYDAAGQDPGELLEGWSRISRSVRPAERTGYDADAGWLVTLVGARGDDWGRLVLLAPEPPTHRLVVLLERAASALALQRLVAREQESLERHAHRTLLSELLVPGPPSPDLVTRAVALGVPLQGRRLVGVAVRPRASAPLPPTASLPALRASGLVRDLAEVVASAARAQRVPAVVGAVDDVAVRALLAVPLTADTEELVRRLATAVHQGCAASPYALPVVIGLGTTVGAVSDARRSLVEAAHVAAAALRSPAAEPACGFHRLEDVRLRGLLHFLRDDERVIAFAERELGPLVARDAQRDSRLVELLRGFCEHGGNKSAAATAAHMSRSAYYQQLASIEQVLGTSLDDAESVLSLYLALLVRDHVDRANHVLHPN
jgi:purine catabolism regulator